VDGKASSILGAISLVTGLASAGLERIGAAGAKQAAKVFGRRVQRGNMLNGEEDVFFTDKMYGNRMAFSTHGTPTGEMVNSAGNLVPASEMVDEISSQVEGAVRYVDESAAKKPLFLLVCDSATSGTGQLMANELDRPVIAFKSTISVPSMSALEQPQGFTYAAKNQTYTNQIYDATPTVQELANRQKEIESGVRASQLTPFSIKGPARWQLFKPQ